MVIFLIGCLFACVNTLICKETEQSIVIKFTYAENDCIQLWNGDTSSGILTYVRIGIDEISQEIEDSLCIPKGFYTLVLSSLNNNGWNPNSKLLVTAEDGIVVIDTLLDSFSQREILVDFDWLLTPTSSWRYHDLYVENWKESNFLDTQWEEARAGFFQAIASSTYTRYYRTVVPAKARPSFAGLRILVKLKYGMVVYANGIELGRYNMPSYVQIEMCDNRGSIQPYTLPLQTEEGVTLRSVFSNQFSLFSDSVVIAVEVHLSAHDSFTDFFALSLFFLPTEAEGWYRLDTASVSTNDFTIPSGLENWVDQDTRTSQILNRNYYIQFSFHQLASTMVSAYSITLSNPVSMPLVGWRVDASQNGMNWKVVDAREGFFFLNRPTHIFELTTLSNAFIYYRFYFLLSSSSVFALDIAEIQFLIQPSMAPSLLLSYPFSSYTFFPGQTNINIQPTLDGFTNAAIVLPLLNGLTFSQSGGFYGSIPETAESQSTLYAVVATHRNGVTYSTQVQLSISACAVSHHRVQFTMTSLGQASKAFWELQHDSMTVVGGSGMDTPSPLQTTQTLCLQEGEYVLHLSSFQEGWPAGTSLHIVMLLQDDSVEFGDVTLPSGTASISIPVLFQLISDGSVTNWFYFSESTIPSDWTSEMTSSSWTTLPSSLTRSGSVCLFRKSFSIQSIVAVASVEFRLFCSPGLILYMNGQYVTSLNVPGGDLTPSTTSTKPGGSLWHIFSFSQSNVHIRSGVNSMAVAVVHSTSTQRVVDFKSIILLHPERTFVSSLNAHDFVYYSVSYSANMHSTHHEVIHLFDSNLNSYYSSAWSDNNPMITISFSESRRESYNMYCFVASATTSSRHDPFSWVVETSTNGDQWTFIHQINSTLFKLGERKCSIFSTVESRYYRFRITNTREINPGSLDIAELALFYDVVHPVGISLDYSQTSFTAFKEIPFYPSYSLNNRDYMYFTIEPALPSGLLIDSMSGLLFGTPHSLAESSLYTISAMTFDSVTATVVISLQVVECEGYNQTYSVLSVHLDDYFSAEEPFNLITMVVHSRFQTLITEQIISPSALSRDTSSQSFSKQVCLSSGLYSLQFVYAIRTGSPTYSISLAGEELYAGELDPSTSLQEFVLSNEKLVHPVYSSWHILLNATEIHTNWYQSDLSASWLEATPSQFETPSSITSYYCTTFQASYSSRVSGFTVGLFTRGGFVVYLNGVELNRVRLPSGDLSTSTLPTSETTEPSYIVYSGSVQFSSFSVSDSHVIEGAPEGHNNRLCIEVHQSLQPLPNDFKCYMEYVQNGADRVVDGEPWGSVDGVASPWDEYISNAFDKNPSTKYFGVSDCQDVIVRWTYNNHRKEYVNHLKLYAGNTVNRRPTSLRIEGSNDLETWTKLHEVMDLEWGSSGGYGLSKEWSFSNTQSYASYQVVGNGCISDGIEFAEILLSSIRVDAACEAIDGFPAASEGQESHGPCPAYHSGYSIRVCQNGVFSEIDDSQCVPTAPTSFSYTPSSLTVYTHAHFIMIPEIPFYTEGIYIKPGLPLGVSLNATTGVISGTPYEENGASSYTVTAMNSRGRTTTTITLIVQSGCPAIGDFPSTPVGMKEVYRCNQNAWMYGSVTRTCLEMEGVPVWSGPDGYCKSLVILLIVIVLVSVIVFAVGITWYVSESMNRRVNVYELPNGEIELEEISEEKTETTVRRRRTLIARPVFIYVPRYFKKTRRDYKEVRRKSLRKQFL